MADSKKIDRQAPSRLSLDLTPDEQKGLQDFWSVYEAHSAEIRAELIKKSAQQPEFKFILSAEQPRQTLEKQSRSLELQRRAIYEGIWEPYLKSLQEQAKHYARAGLSFHAWFEIVGDFRGYIRPYLLAVFGNSSSRLLPALDGLDRFVDITLATIGDSYLVLTQEMIREQEAALLDSGERQQSDARFRGLLESAPDAIVVVNAFGIIEIVNSQTENLFGYERSALLGKPIEILIPERFREGHGAYRANYMVQPVTRPMGTGLELFGSRSDGSEFPVEISLSPLETEDGPLVSAAVRDVTLRKQTDHEVEELNSTLQRRATELEVANRELEAFSYSVSHDLRAPLRTIDGFSQALLEDYHDQLPKDAQHFLQRVRNAAQRMAKLIDDLLELSRISRIPVDRKPINVSALAQSIADELQQAEPQRRVTFEIAPHLKAHGDSQLLRVALQT
jgi:PAS domain S-box-containing protein